MEPSRKSNAMESSLFMLRNSRWRGWHSSRLQPSVICIIACPNITALIFDGSDTQIYTFHIFTYFMAESEHEFYSCYRVICVIVLFDIGISELNLFTARYIVIPNRDSFTLSNII